MKKHAAVQPYKNKDPYFTDTVKYSNYVIEEKNINYIGIHILIDMWEPKHIDNLQHVETALRHSITVSIATLLHLHLHKFEKNGGITGVAVLAESHISIHTWPERNFAAFDIFTCGNTNPQAAAEALREAFLPKNFKILKALRG